MSDNCSISCLNVLLFIVASDFKEPLKMQQGITAVVPGISPDIILLIFLCPSRFIKSC